MSEPADGYARLLDRIAKGELTIAREESAADAEHRRRKDWLLVRASLLAAGALAVIAVFAAFGPWATAAQQSLGGQLLSAMIGGIVGYLFGRRG